MRNKIIILVFGLCGAGLIWLGIVSAQNNATKTATVTVEAAPASASVKINNAGARSGKNKVRPGDVTVIVSKAGFATETRNVTAKAQEEVYTGIVLASNTSTTADWYTTHAADQKLAEGISSHSFDNTANLQLTSAPILQHLPYVSAKLEYRIDYGGARNPSKPDQPVIFIKAYTAVDRANALKWIRSYGYDPSTLDIVFLSVTNPFNGERT